jgi:hypothetical protein
MNMREVTFPAEIALDPRQYTRAIFVHNEQGLFAPHGMQESFRQVNDSYTNNRGERFSRMASEIFTLDGLDIAFKRDERDTQTRDLLVVYSPLNDGKPESEPATITQHVTDGTISKNAAKPNSHRPAVKLDGDYEFGHAEGMGMPRLQLFAREAPAMTHEQKRRVAAGDMTPYGELSEKPIAEAERIMREIYGISDFRFDRLHFFVAGMGAKALGAAAYHLALGEREPGAITLMNFSLGEQSMAKLTKNYTGREMIDEDSKLILPEDYVRVPEFTALMELDDAELAMRIRQGKALLNWRMVMAIMNAKRGVDYLENALEHGSTVTIANGAQEAMTSQTKSYLPVGDERLHLTDIVGVDGEKVGMAANEHGTALALVSNLGLYNHLNRVDK